MEELKGKTAVVTGAASGIGKAIAAKSRAEGMNVVMADVEEDALAQARDELGGGARNVISVVTDVSQPQAVDELARKTLDAFGSADLLFNNAGVGAGTTAWESTLEDWTWVIGVNLWGVDPRNPDFRADHAEAEAAGSHRQYRVDRGAGKGPPQRILRHYQARSGRTDRATGGGVRENKGSHRCFRAMSQLGQYRINESGRNRPANLLNKAEIPPTPEMLKAWEQMQEFIKRATPPAVIADAVFEEGIRKGKLYIIPHKETVQYIRNRFDGIMKDA